LVFAEFYGTKRTFSHYKRYTYFVSSRLTNKIFVEQIQNEGDFSSIERIKQAFDVEPVTKQFYERNPKLVFYGNGSSGISIRLSVFPRQKQRQRNS
jgi:adenine-specific DNA-methyltransferase